MESHSPGGILERRGRKRTTRPGHAKVGAAVRGTEHRRSNEKSDHGSLPLVAFKIFYDLIRGIIIIMF